MKKEEKKINEVEVYKAYVKAKGIKGYSVIKLCEKLGIPRPTLYSLIKKFKHGDEIQLRRCLSRSKYDCLWEFRYQRRFSIIDEKHSEKYPEQIKSLIKDMHKDGFGIRDISRRVEKDPSTVKYHIDGKKN